MKMSQPLQICEDMYRKEHNLRTFPYIFEADETF